MREKLCSVDACDNPHLARGWCTMHYARWKAHGDPLVILIRPKVSRYGSCTVDDCDGPIRALGYCATHYSRWQRNSGDPLPDKPINRKQPLAASCSIHDCENPPIARAWCSKHYNRWRHYGDPLGSAPDGPGVEERFWAKVDRNGSGGCWLWMASVDQTGYAQFRHDLGGSAKAHRYAYMIHVGPIPEGMFIDHKCRVRACVNPAHLRLATPGQNAQNVGTRTSKFGVRGVRQTASGKWVGRVHHQGRSWSAGVFATIAEAETAVKKLRRQLFTHNDDDWSGIHGQLDLFGSTA